jgi:hypothetical protein
VYDDIMAQALACAILLIAIVKKVLDKSMVLVYDMRVSES